MASSGRMEQWHVTLRASHAALSARRPPSSSVSSSLSYMAKGGEIGGFGGGWLEHPRQWLGTQWPGPLTGSAGLPRATRRALGRCRSRAGALPRGTL
eukprot:scaffold67640_cov63-Phaeocystis_antarctica.AAC.3